MANRFWKHRTVVAAALVVAGCAQNGRPTTQPVADDVAGFEFPTTSALPPAVNVFGELNNTPRPPGPTVGDEGYQQQTFADEGADSDVTVDPTGKWIAFASTRHTEHAGIYLQRVDGTAVTRLTNDNSENAFPTFSPDGRQVAFCSTRGGVWNIYAMDVDGRNVVTLTTGITQCVHPSYSPDGTRIAYSSLGVRSNQWELWTVNLNTGERRQIGAGLFPAWSPDKSVDRIAFQKARQRGSRWFSLWTLDLVDGESRRVTEVAVSSNAAIVSPSWSPDGKRLTFATLLDPAHKNHPTRGEQDVWTIAADGTDRRRVTDGNGINLSPAWGADNRIYFVSDRGGAEAVWSVRSDVGRPAIATAPQAKPAQPKEATADTRDVDR